MAATSVRASQKGFPVSEAMQRAMASLCSPSSSPKRRAMATRYSNPARDHPVLAARAASTALATWASSAALPCQSTSPVAGFREDSEGPLPSCHWLLIGAGNVLSGTAFGGHDDYFCSSYRGCTGTTASRD